MECIQEDKESPNNIRSAVNAHLTCIAISKSAELGRPVRIDALKLLVE